MIASSELQPVKANMAHMAIRRMRESDLPDVMSIEAASFGRHHWSDDSFVQEMNNPIGRYYVLVEKIPDLSQSTSTEKVVGYAGVWFIIDEAHVTTVAVQPEYRGNALGEVLFLHLLEQCYGISIKWVTLEVRASNYSAQNLYYKYGLQSVGLRPKYYQDNQEDAMIMTSPDISTEEYRTIYKKCKQQLTERLKQLPAGFGEK
jgi:ribosomal-protein-alanine N-acetyltransferase